MMIRPVSRLWAISMISIPIAIKKAARPIIFFMAIPHGAPFADTPCYP